MDLNAFMAYDIRGRVPDQIDEDFAERLGRAYVEVTGAARIAVGYDIRLSSPVLKDALVKGILAAGSDVYDIGLGGTEQVYFATFHYDLDGGIMVTASHNPQDYNGMKLVGKNARPISGDSGLLEIQARMDGICIDAEHAGTHHQLDCMADYAAHLLAYVDVDRLRPLRIVVNAGNGGAGLVVDALADRLPFEFIRIDHEPDGHFPHGVPNPLLPENRARTAEAVRAHGADMGLAWDGDFDRCFFFDELGQFIEGYYVVGLLAEAFLAHHPGEKIIHDPRLTWNTVDIVHASGGKAIQSKTGHAYIKQIMRSADAVYGGEMSAHHYFRDFAYCDSGMIPWLLVAELISVRGKSLGDMVAARLARFPASGEINRTVEDAVAIMERVQARYAAQAQTIEHVDGLSLEFENWRFNLRRSNTEPLLRLNVESRGDRALMERKTAELLNLIDQPIKIGVD